MEVRHSLLLLLMACGTEDVADVADPCAPADLAESGRLPDGARCDVGGEVPGGLPFQWRDCETEVGTTVQQLVYSEGDERVFTRVYRRNGELIATAVSDDEPPPDACASGAWRGLHPDAAACATLLATGRCEP
jgi:hypothetical protein